jgi:hypothetical protein
MVWWYLCGVDDPWIEYNGNSYLGYETFERGETDRHPEIYRHLERQSERECMVGCTPSPTSTTS